MHERILVTFFGGDDVNRFALNDRWNDYCYTLTEPPLVLESGKGGGGGGGPMAIDRLTLYQ